MENGNLIKQKVRYTTERFETVEGWIDFLIGSAIWGFFIAKYSSVLQVKFYGWVDFLQTNWLRLYASYLLLGIATTILGLIITYVIVKAYHGVKTR